MVLLLPQLLPAYLLVCLGAILLFRSWFTACLGNKANVFFA